MKKIIVSIILLSLIMSFSTLYSCTEKEHQKDGIKIVATLFPQYDIARNIAGDKAEIELLLPPGADSHSFDPSMQDIMRMNDADLFIYTGSQMELWSEPFAKNVPSTCTVVDVSQGIELCSVSGHDDHDHINVDPHIWTSPVNYMKMANTVCNSLCTVDPDNAEHYKSNTEEYVKKLENLDEEIRSVAEDNSKKLYFGGEFAFLYFVNEYGFSYSSLYDSCSSHSEPSAKKIAEMITEMKKNGASVIFYPELSSAKAAKSVSQETGAKLLLLHSCHNLTEEEISSGEDYITLMYKNLSNIKEALS